MNSFLLQLNISQLALSFSRLTSVQEEEEEEDVGEGRPVAETNLSEWRSNLVGIPLQGSGNGNKITQKYSWNHANRGDDVHTFAYIITSARFGPNCTQLISYTHTEFAYTHRIGQFGFISFLHNENEQHHHGEIQSCEPEFPYRTKSYTKKNRAPRAHANRAITLSEPVPKLKRTLVLCSTLS